MIDFTEHVFQRNDINPLFPTLISLRFLNKYTLYMYTSVPYKNYLHLHNISISNHKVHITICEQRRWVILLSQEPTELQISKLKFKLYRKNQKCILVIALNRSVLDR